MSSSALVTVFLIDVNDNPPEFERSIYSILVRESVEVGTVVGTVFATSRDVGVNAEITYTKLEDSDFSFDVKPDTGD